MSSHRRGRRGFVGPGLVGLAVAVVATGATVLALAQREDSAASGPANSEPARARYSKVLVIMEENETRAGVVGDSRAPYLTGLATTFGQATRMDAGYPAKCPSLAAYILLTSGDDHDICDDKPPTVHRLAGPNVFAQTTAAGKRWRVYSQDSPENCAQANSGLFAVRHVPSNYYVDLREECLQNSVPMGSLESGPFADDVASGTLPELGMLIPNLCNDMHGAKGCPEGVSEAVAAGDEWLRTVLPAVLAGPDYREGRLAVFVAWDEGTKRDNNIPFVAISPTTQGRSVDEPTSLCSILATVSDILKVSPLGCAADAPSMTTALGLDAKAIARRP